MANRLNWANVDQDLLDLINEESLRTGQTKSETIQKYVRLGYESSLDCVKVDGASPEPVELVPGMTFYP